MLDVTRTTKRQLSRFDDLFDRLSKKALRPYNDLKNDPVRHDLDAAVLEVLKIDGVDLGPVYEWIANDPQFFPDSSA